MKIYRYGDQWNITSTSSIILIFILPYLNDEQKLQFRSHFHPTCAPTGFTDLNKSCKLSNIKTQNQPSVSTQECHRVCKTLECTDKVKSSLVFTFCCPFSRRILFTVPTTLREYPFENFLPTRYQLYQVMKFIEPQVHRMSRYALIVHTACYNVGTQYSHYEPSSRPSFIPYSI